MPFRPSCFAPLALALSFLAAAPLRADDGAVFDASVNVDNLQGTWDITVGNLGSGTAVIEHKGKKLLADVDTELFPKTIKLKGKFTPEIPDTITLKKTFFGREIVMIITFLSESEFTGTLAAADFGIEQQDLHGVKRSPAAADLAADAKTSPLEGNWTVTIDTLGNAQLAIEKSSDKKITATVTAAFIPFALKLKGKYEPEIPDCIQIQKNIGGQNICMYIQFLSNTEFVGVLNAPGFGIEAKNIHGLKQ